MKKKVNKVFVKLLIIYALLPNNLNAEATRLLKMGVAQFPPYAYKTDTGEIKGLEVEILRTCFTDSPYQIDYVHLPYGRLPIELANKTIDGHITTLPTAHSEFYYSQVVAPEYHAVAISLTENKIELNSVSDLSNKSIIAHQRATQYYGQQYAAIAKKNGLKYRELADQMQQIKLLYNNLADVIVIGKNIFYFFKNQAIFNTNKAIDIHPILGGKVGYHNVFNSAAARDYFDKCLVEIKKNGRYQELVEKSFFNK